MSSKSKATATKEPLRGKELLRAAVNQIILHPKTWNQTSWHCGTSHCIGGWCQVLAGLPPKETVMAEVPPLLGIERADADYLFDGSRTLPQIHDFAKVLIEGGEFFNLAGFDPAGFNRAGFNRAGFDRAGFNRAGFDRAGFDRAGFDRAGFNRAGFDRAGFNRDGRDIDGKPLPLL